MESPTDCAIAKSTELLLKPFLAVEARDSSNILFNRRRVVVLSDTHFEVYNKSGKSRAHAYSWLELEAIDMPDADHLHLKFGFSNFVFSSDQLKTLISGVVDTLQRYFTKAELQELLFQSLYFFKSKPTPISIYNRFLYKLAEAKIAFSEEEIEYQNYYQYLFMTQRPAVNITDMPLYETIAPIFFDCLPLIPFIESLTVPSYLAENVDSFALLMPFIAQPSYLRFLQIEGRTGDSYTEFMLQLKENTRSRLNGISFTDAELTIDQLTQLVDAVSARRFSSLGFHNSISPPARIYFCSTFFTGAVSKSLKMLDLSGTTGLDIRILFQKIRSVAVLSLENCGLEVSEIITAFSMTSLPLLKVVNLSGNLFNIPLPSSPNLPHNIQSIVANGITFPDNHLITFISFLFTKFQAGLKLSLSNTLASTDEWFRVFNFIQKSSYSSLTALTWDSNPTYPSLFDFLSKNTRLEYLSLCGCFYESNQAPISAVADYLETASSLRYLIMRGNKTSYFGKFTVAILCSLRQLNSLEKLDISFNNGGDETILALRVLVAELPHLKHLSFDGTRANNSQQFTEFLQFCRKKENRVDTPFPENDFLYLSKRLQITDEQIAEQRTLAFTKPKPCTITKNKDYRRPTDSTLDLPCCLSVDTHSTAFPTFLTGDEIRALGGEEAEDETYIPESVALEYNVDDAPYIDENDARTIASLDFKNSKSTIERQYNIPLSPTSVRSRGLNPDEDSSMSRKRTVASLIRRAKTERAESISGTPDSPLSQKSISSRQISVKSARAPVSSRSIPRKAQTKRIISPYHQGLSAENVDRHSWEFPGNYEIHFDENIWKAATTEFSIQTLYDDIRGEKGSMSRKAGEVQSVTSKVSKRSQLSK